MKLLTTTALLLATALATPLWAIDAQIVSQYAAPYTVAPGKLVEVENTVRVTKTMTGVTARFVLLDDADKVVFAFPMISYGTLGIGNRSLSTQVMIPSNLPDGSYRLRTEMTATGVKPELVGKQFSEFLRIIVRKGASSLASANLKPSTPLTNPTRLTLNDNFNSGLNRSVWTPGMATPGVPNAEEIQWYTPDEVAPMSGGLLRLNAHKKDFMGKNYTAGAITTADGFTQLYGHFEARVKMSGNAGTWPAFWLLQENNVWPPEIDIFEHLGKDHNTVYMNSHGTENGAHKQQSKTVTTAFGLSADYHVFALDWRPEALVYSIDGKEVHRITDKALIPNKPMYMVLNLALGGSWAGPVNPSEYFPAMFDIDYVRVYQFTDLPAAPQPAMQLSKSVLNQRAVKPGDTVTLTGSLAIGSKPVKAVEAQAFTTDFLGNGWTFAGKVSFGDLAANRVVPYTFTFKVPANYKTGIYNVGVLALTSTAVDDPSTGTQVKMVTRNLADQLVVTEPAVAVKK